MPTIPFTQQERAQHLMQQYPQYADYIARTLAANPDDVYRLASELDIRYRQENPQKTREEIARLPPAERQALIDRILARLNSPQDVAASGGTRWGYDSGRGVWYTESPSGERRYENMGSTDTEMGALQGVPVRSPQGGNLAMTGAKWDPATGTWKRSVDWQKLGALGATALLGGTAIGLATGGGAAGAGAAGGGAAGGGGAATGGGIAGTVGAVAPTVGELGGFAPAAGAAASTPWWKRYLLGQGTAAAGDIAKAVIQSRATGAASQAERDALDRALEAAKEQQEYERRIAAEKTAYEREQDAYRRKTAEEQRDYSRGQYGSYLGRLDPYAQVGPGALSRLTGLLTGSLTQPSSGGTVTLRAPDGSMSAVPSDQADHYLRLGATRA